VPDAALQTPLWTPSELTIERAQMTRFMRWAGERRGAPFASYDELWRWSTEELEVFWAAIWDYFGVRHSRAYERVLGSHEMPGARWFEGAELNYAENLLAGLTGERGTTSDRRSRTAVIHTSELREGGELTWGELRDEVALVAAGLRALGVERGDRVAAYMPNIPETLIAFLATASLGAIWSSAAPEFGARSVVDRFAQIEPKLLFAVDGYRHGGKDFDRSAALEDILAGLPTVAHVVLLDYLSPSSDRRSASAMRERARGGRSWESLRELGKEAGASECGEDRVLTFEQVPFGHPLWVLYSSGTTGLPKAIVQGHGGILVEQLKKSLHLDLNREDRMFWFTTTGWMMWNFLVGCLLADCAIVLYDGSPAHPDLGAMFALAERTGMTCMGVSAGLLASAQKAGVRPAHEYDLGRLRAMGSTGSPLAPESFRWVYEEAGEDIWLYSTSGGTDVCTAFVGGCPLLPVYEGELQCRALGCAVEAWDEQGNSVVDEVGELVITEPMPSMPLFFWGDDDGSRLRESYFSMFPGVWRHGDWIRITPRGGAFIYGRSDSTINRQGVRMGTSEIYRATATVPEVLDALVVDVVRGGAATADRSSASRSAGELWMVLFVVLDDGVVLDDELRARISSRIREDCSPRHVPNEILQIDEVPRTLSGKVLEVPVKKILMGAPAHEAASADSLANPRSLDYFVALADRWRESATARASGR
jgi:acetoacetyl-CoA synthetase